MKRCNEANKPVHNLFLFLCALFVLSVCPTNAMANGDYVVICNSSNPVDKISAVDLKNIFLGKKVSWDNGAKITFVTLKTGESHKKFIRNHVKKNPQQFKNYWKKMLFTGKGVIPRSFSDDASVIKFVSQNENSIGYISKDEAADGIKLLPITD